MRIRGLVVHRAVFAFGIGAAIPAMSACEEPPAVRVAPVPEATPEGVVGDITAGDVAARIGFLAHDLLAGRATPSPGLEVAARYIASEFATWGLQPTPGHDALLQWYTFEAPDGTARAMNVAAVVRGTDPDLRDTWIVYSAHMDHVGIGAPDASGDSIYNGADDDASGTAALMEIAEAFASHSERPARSIAFVAVSGEETGLFGSKAFVTEGGIPTSSMVANINIDMVGRNAPDSLVVIGMRYSDLGERLERIVAAHPGLGLAIADDPWPEERFFFRSDHYNFAAAGVPAVFLFSGVHADYHRPSDEPQTIDAGKIARIATAAFLLGLDLASDPERPAWTGAGRAALRGAAR